MLGRSSLLNSLLTTLRGMEKDLEIQGVFQEAEAERALMLVQAIGEGNFHPRFVEFVHVLPANNRNPTASVLVKSAISIVSTQIEIEDAERNGNENLDFEPKVSLSEPDRSKILALCRDISAVIAQTSQLSDEHKTRVIKCVKSLEVEVLRAHGFLYRLLGQVDMVGSQLATLGQQVKPLVDRCIEAVTLIKGASDDPLALPAPEQQKQLEPPKEESNS